jgi:hypothetical protein
MSASPERFVSSTSRTTDTSVADITKSPSSAVIAATQLIKGLDLDSDEESLLVAAQVQTCKL